MAEEKKQDKKIVRKVLAQGRWDGFTNVKYEMLRQINTTHALWTIIRSNDKHQARLNAITMILNSVSCARLNPKLDFVPDPKVLVSGARELEIMEAQLLKIGEFTH